MADYWDNFDHRQRCPDGSVILVACNAAAHRLAGQRAGASHRPAGRRPRGTNQASAGRWSGTACRSAPGWRRGAAHCSAPGRWSGTACGPSPGRRPPRRPVRRAASDRGRVPRAGLSGSTGFPRRRTRFTARSGRTTNLTGSAANGGGTTGVLGANYYRAGFNNPGFGPTIGVGERITGPTGDGSATATSGSSQGSNSLMIPCGNSHIPHPAG